MSNPGMIAMDWNKIAARYMIIATVGSVLIVAGTYFMHQYKVELKLDLGSIMHMQDLVITESPNGNSSAGKEPSPVFVLPSSPPPKGSNTPTTIGTPVKPPSAATQFWAVTQARNTKTYNRSGKYLRTIPDGTLVDISAIKKTSAGELAVCKIIYEGREIPDLVIKTSDLDIQTGSLAEANPREKDLRVQYVNVLKEISEREKQVAESAKSKNPHYAKFKQAEAAYTAMRKKTEDLIRNRDSAQGADRMEVYDQLRTLKGQSVAVKQAYDQAKQVYSEWNDHHAQQLVPPDDAQLASLRARLRSVEDELRTYPKR